MKAVVIILLILCNILVAEQTVRLAKISLPDHSEVYKLHTFDITVTDAGRDFAKVLVNDTEIADLRAAGYQVEILIEDYKKYKDEVFERGFYHTYAQVYAVLDSFVTDYPDICRLDTIGSSVQGRAIWAMRVTDNPDTEENEPEIRLAGNMHGDEHIGTEITLYFLRYLLTNYATNAQVQALVDNREIWILPTLNPDGKVANTRRNANNVDLNRDYGYFWDAWGGSPGPSSQIENKLMMQHLAENDIVLEYNYHSAAQYVNYPWDYHYADPPDSQHIINLSEIYADSASLTAINGYDWYQVTGSLQDYTFGTSGALAWTIETSEPSTSSQIDQICYNNRDALMDICGRAGWGIEGVVKDSVTGTPLYARIEFMDPDRVDIYTDPNLGDFHKMIEQGTYDLRVSANGYVPRVISDVTVSDTGSTVVGDVLLVPDSSFLYAFRAVLCRYASHAEQANATRPRAALGPEDSLYFSLGQGGYVVLEMGPGSPIGNNSGDDMTVYEGDDGTAEGYEVFVSNSWDGSWYSCGSATGTASFDLSVAGLSQARYVRIEDDGSSSSGSHAGFDLDAVEGAPLPIEPRLVVSDYGILDGNNGSLDPGETADFVITLLNVGTLEATSTQGTLRTDDVYVIISDSSGYYGVIAPDSEKTNMSDPFTIAASDSTPIGHTVSFDLIVQADDYADTLGINLVVGKKHYYVWNPDPTPGPGQNIDSILTTLGYNGDYGTTLAPDLSMYRAVFVCVGIFPNKYVIGSGSQEAAALVDYLENHAGRMYLDGGDVWYYDPVYQGGYDFGSLFGIDGISDGNGDVGPVLGESSTFTQGMNFTYGGENNWIDRINPAGTGFLVFHDGDNAYNCGVANDPGNYRTVGTSFELGLLTDGSAPSTRAVLLDSIMHFFGISMSSDTTPPAEPYMTQVEKSGADVELTWNRVMSDTLGNPEVMDCYVVYRNMTPSFVPSASDSIATVLHPETTYIDSGVLDSAASYYYLVKAVDEVGNRSKKSNMSYAFHEFLNENAGATSDRNWVSLPYKSVYDSIKDLTSDLSPSGDPISKITRLEPETQDYYSWIYHAVLGWYGNGTPANFPLVSGQAYEMVAAHDDTVILVGCNDPAGLIVLNENAGAVSDRNWVALPYNAIYSTVSAITDELSPGGEPVSKITRLDEETQVYYSWIYHQQLGWYGNGVPADFVIEPGDGYEFVATKDTTWNPSEYSNSGSRFMAAKRAFQMSDRKIITGTEINSTRTPVWSLDRQSPEKMDYRDAGLYMPVTRYREQVDDYQEPGISHIVYADLELEGLDNLVFTVYRPERPHDVLTEQSVGCVTVKQGSVYCLISFDVGNFRGPWHAGEEVVLIIEATQDGRGYFTVMNFELDKGVDIQQVSGNITLIPIPEPVVRDGKVGWSRVDNDNIVGYSIYRDGTRINERVITESAYGTAGDVVVKPVIKGGYETVYCAHQGPQSIPGYIPISYACAVSPNPFVNQTRIDYALSNQTQVEIVLYDISGRRITTLVSRVQEPGYYSTIWDGADDRGRQVSSGVYFVRFEAGAFSLQQKILLVR